MNFPFFRIEKNTIKKEDLIEYVENRLQDLQRSLHTDIDDYVLSEAHIRGANAAMQELLFLVEYFELDLEETP